MFGGFKKSRTFATAIERESDKKLNGAFPLDKVCSTR